MLIHLELRENYISLIEKEIASPVLIVIKLVNISAKRIYGLKYFIYSIEHYTIMAKLSIE